MKYYFLLLFVIAFSLNSSAQNKKTVTNDGYAVIKGHVTNPENNFWEYVSVGYLGYKNLSARIDEQGNFITRVKLESNYTDVLLKLGRGVVIYLQKNDTVTINWNAKVIANTITVKTGHPGRDTDLKMEMALTDLFISSSEGLNKILYAENIADSVKFSNINQLYNKAIAMLTAGNCSEQATFKMGIDIYYRCASHLLDQHLLKKYDLFIENPSPKFKGATYQLESEVYFKSSSDYRKFIYDYVRLEAPFSAWGPTYSPGQSVTNLALNTCYAGMMAFHIYEMRDWYLTKTIISYFSDASFNEGAEAYNLFLPQIKKTFYIDTLKKFYAGISSLKEGAIAPAFKLKNEKGQLISLDMFKGKAVYIDFWGTRCGPCIEEMVNNVPSLHSKYKDKNIVFINICVDTNETEWKASLKKLNPQGINLIAEGWTKNPVCKAYNVSGIPHYCLIDKEGKIADANSPRPGQQFQLHNKIDALLK